MEMGGIIIMRGERFRHSEGKRDQLADLFVSTPFYIVRFIEISTPLNLDGSYNFTHGNLLKTIWWSLPSNLVKDWLVNDLCNISHH
jgi:hypothetical protein